MSSPTVVLIVVAVLGSALVAGIFFAFSNFVMKALGLLPPNQGIAAMQSINVTVINPGFFAAFFGTGVICLVLVFLALTGRAGDENTYLLVGSALYVLGCVLVTIAFNVPLNDRLAAVDPEGEEGASVWSLYLDRWTFWNHVRTAASLAASAVLAGALF